MKHKKILYWIMGIALVGVAISLYTLLFEQGVVSAEFCEINATFDCVSVNTSRYAYILGIPVALLGVIGYGFMAIAAFLKIRNPQDMGLSTFLVLAALGGLGFSLYLTGIEAFVLYTWCILCIASQLTMLAAALLVACMYRSERNQK